MYWQEITSSPLLVSLVLVSAVAIPVYNFYGVTITKVYDSLTRSLLNVCRTGLLWLFGLVLTACVQTDSYYRIEDLSLQVNFVKMIGFVCIVLGTLVYNKVVLRDFLRDRQ